MSTKEAVIEMIRRLPDDVTTAEIVEGLRVRMRIEEGLRQLDNGEVISHDEAKAKLARWLA